MPEQPLAIEIRFKAKYISCMVISSPPTQPATQHLSVPGGRIAYDIQGTGPLLLLVPGMGEIRATYRHLAPILAEAGFTVATADLRGHGDSDADFPSYGDVETASDIAALLRHIGSPAVVVGNSMAAGSAVIVAAGHPELIESLVLLGPFVRNPEDTAPVKELMFRVMMGGPWAPMLWNAYVPTLYSGRKPEGFPAYRSMMMSAMKRPGYSKAFRLTTRTDHTPAEEALPQVNAPSLIVMGAKDPDFKDPAAEASWVAQALNGTVAMIDDAGHYPQSQQPQETAEAMIEFLQKTSPHA